MQFESPFEFPTVIDRINEAVIEEIRQLDAVSIFKFQSLVTLLILLCPNRKGESSVFGFSLTKHPFVEKKIVITGGRHYKSERTTPWT